MASACRSSSQRHPLELCLLPSVFLNYYLNDSGGYDVLRLPSSTKQFDRVKSSKAREL